MRKKRAFKTSITGFLVFWITKGLFHIVTFIFLCGTWLIPGKKKYLNYGCQIVIARHRSRWDIPLIALTVITSKSLFVARKGLKALQWIEKNPRLLKLLNGKYIVFVDRGNPTPKDVRLITGALKYGKIKFIVIFPEGATRPEERCINPGFIILAKRYNLFIRPVNIIPWGCYGKENNETPKKVLTLKARHTSIRVGKPFSYNELLEKLKEKLGRKTVEELDRRCLDKKLAELSMEIVDKV